MSLRLEGQDCLATITRDGEILGEFPIENWPVDLLIDAEATRYAGENAPRYREVFNGAQFSASGHAEGSSQSKGVLAFFEAVMQRSRRQSVGMKINFSGTLVWPNGDTKTVVMSDCYISAPKFNVQGTDLVTFSFEGKCSNPSIV